MPDPAHHAGLADGARAIVGQLQQAGFLAYWAGGCVRDHLLGRPAKDYDIATQARPDEVLKLFPASHAVGRAFGVILVHQDGHTYEVATFRRDLGYPDGRHPEAVVFTGPEEDAGRRDFTINGLFYDPLSGQILDFVGGRADLAARTIRAIGDPASRFAEDYLRMLRAVRFAATLGFSLDPATAEAIRTHADRLRALSAERIQGELIRLLTESEHPGQAVDLLNRTGQLAVILPEVAALKGVAQPPEYHPEGDVYQHTVNVLDQLTQPSATLALACLLHDVGKPATQQRVPTAGGGERIRFDRHAEVGAEMAEQILQRLRCSRKLTDQVVLCVRQHMRFMEVTRMRRSTLRRLVMSPTFGTELELHRADCLGSHGHLDHYEFVKQFAESIREESLKPAPWLTGHDVLAAGVPAGSEIRYWLDKAYDLQLEGRLRSRPEALAWLTRERPPGTARHSNGRPPDREAD